MTDERARSEQQEELDRGDVAATQGNGEPAHQFTTPGGGGELVDDEPDLIGVDAGEDPAADAENQAMRIEDDEDASGRVGGPTSGYLER